MPAIAEKMNTPLFAFVQTSSIVLPAKGHGWYSGFGTMFPSATIIKRWRPLLFRMKKITAFFWFCSGADTNLLQKCPTESGKYTGIGATIFFTGLFAALAAGYALFTVFDNVWAASVLGLLWGLMIFNLDRYIVSSMRKAGRTSRELLSASPRIVLAVIISIVIAKPLELKIFEKEIAPELVIMEQQNYAKQERELRGRFDPSRDSLKAGIEMLKREVALKAAQRDALVRSAQEEADGTGGSKRRNLGPIYKVKKADADAASREFELLRQNNERLINARERNLQQNDSLETRALASLDRGKMDGPAARMEALSRLTRQSDAIFWANWFIILLFIAMETAPVFVKLISDKGPYDNLLKIEEHGFSVQETEKVADTNAAAKQRMSGLPDHERTFASDKLDTALKEL